MKIVCVGGGPAGLTFAIQARLRSGGRDEVVVAERSGYGSAQGFAVTLGEDILDAAYRADPVGAPALRGALHLWGDQVVDVAGRQVHLGGRYGYAVGRSRMLSLLADRAVAVGADVRFGAEVTDDPATDPLTADADLVVAADGINSRIRTRHATHFGTEVSQGRNKYVWFGTTRRFRAFTFAYERTEAGWIWFYAYPASDGPSTCIVECPPATWAGLGLDAMPGDEAMRMLERRFARALDGHALVAPPGMGASPWLEFREVRNATWRRDNLVLAGDAAHTTHFSIGSGTVLAMEDAYGLADAVYGGPARTTDGGLSAALAAYDARRRAQMRPIQDMARRSMEWFEVATEGLDADPVRFAWSLSDRRGDQHPLHYQLHRATQIDPVRRVRRRLTSARRLRRALRRGEPIR
ncbi:FAD-dependent monooxygenase [Pseudonocardia ailaonensis]|uniref:FAD-dependent monooxygenase n=1 Tax=Pseudonocardia ailaonensis TaxID=367279 RepID=A0ABN2NAU8_9PSEU